MTKEELDRTLENLREKYKTIDPVLRPSLKKIADHATWLYEKDTGRLPPTQLVFDKI
jgi:hypothetical protein